MALVASHFLQVSTREHVALIAYCFMPDHVHLLAAGMTATADLRRFVSSGKQVSAFNFRRARHARLWQRYGFERVLRDDEQTFRSARYIIENPVRARLTSTVIAYPFWGSSAYSREELLEHIQQAG